MNPSTPCKYCGKAFKNVKAHITKSHSWLQMTTEENGDISDRCATKGEFEMFWRGEHYTIDAVTYEGGGDCGLGFGNVYVTMTRSPHHPSMWVVKDIHSVTTIERPDGSTQDTFMEHTGYNIQVLHKRLGPE